MPNKDPRVDAYIDGAAPFAQPILRHIRMLIHQASPVIDEQIKWRKPSFEHKGIVAGMAAFKQHVTLTLWKGGLLDPLPPSFRKCQNHAMVSVKLRQLTDLGDDATLLTLIKKAISLNHDGIKAPAKNEKTPKVMNRHLAGALAKAPVAQAQFDAFSPSNQRDYIEWIDEAKRDTTRQNRLKTAIEWISEGKPRNWKYMKSWGGC